MSSKIINENSEHSKFFNVLKNKRFWLIQIYNLLRPLQIMLIALLLGYCEIVLMGLFLMYKEFEFTIQQQHYILSVFESVIIIALIFHLINKFIFLFFNKDVDDVIPSFCISALRIAPFYLIGGGSLSILSDSLSTSTNSNSNIFLSHLLNSFPVGSIFILIVFLIVGQKVMKSIIFRKIEKDNTMKDWIVYVNENKITSYDRSTNSKSYIAYSKHYMDVRLKYSYQHFIFVGNINEMGDKYDQEEMNDILNHFPQQVIKSATTTVLPKFKKSK